MGKSVSNLKAKLEMIFQKNVPLNSFVVLIMSYVAPTASVSLIYRINRPQCRPQFYEVDIEYEYLKFIYN